MLTRAQKRAKLEAETRATDAREAARCPVCFEDGAVRCGCGQLKGILCSNNHALCIECVCKLVRPCVNDCPCPTNFHYDCPICRVRTGLTHFEVMALIKRDRQEAVKVVDAAFVADAARARIAHMNRSESESDVYSGSEESAFESDDDDELEVLVSEYDSDYNSDGVRVEGPLRGYFRRPLRSQPR